MEFEEENGWFAIFDDGTALCEASSDWKNIQTEKIVTLGVSFNGRLYSLPSGHRSYFRTISACSEPGKGVTILSYNVGYKDGNIEVTLRVHVETGNCVLDIQGV